MSKPRAVECVKSSGHVLSLTSCELIILLPCSVSSGNLVLVPDPVGLVQSANQIHVTKITSRRH